MWKDLLTLTRGEQRGLIVLLLMLIILILLRFSLDIFYQTGKNSRFGQGNIVLLKADTVEVAAASTETARQNLNVFDPNSVSEEQLVAFGIPKGISHNWTAYLKAGGRFRLPEDVGRIYGMNDTMLHRLLPYMRTELKSEPKPIQPKPVLFDLNHVEPAQLFALGWDSAMVGSLFTMKEDLWFPGWYQDHRMAKWTVDSINFIGLNARKKFKTQVNTAAPVVNINSADETQWMELRGIGEAYSRRIVAYRNLLGGFVSVKQVAEVYGISGELLSDIEQFLILDTIALRQINVNKASVADLRRHPYIDFYIASEIIERRKELRHIDNLEQLDSLKSIERDKLELLKHYLCTE